MRLRVCALATICIALAAWSWAFPRGPQTGWAAAVSITVALALGIWQGKILRGTKRPLCWAAISVGSAIAVRELARPTLALPTTVIAPASLWHGSTYALAALALGRGLDLVLTGIPWAVGLVTTLTNGRCWRATAILTLAVSAACLIPATTPHGAPGQYAEIARLDVRGCKQRYVVRGRVGAPVIVFFSGGPGGTEIGTLRNRWHEIENAFTVITWDQTGAGLNTRCFPRNGELRLDHLTGDAATLLHHINQRYGRKPILVGNSWGTFLATLVVRDHPDLVSAYVGTGQMVDLAATDQAFYDDTLAWAGTHERPDLVTTLKAQGPPPYEHIYPYQEVFAHESDWNPWDRDPRIGAAIDPLANVVDKPELDPISKLRYPANVMDSFAAIYPRAQGIDLRHAARRLDVPTYLAAGVHEARGRDSFAREWFDQLRAPHKEWIDFDRSGHKAFGEQPIEFERLLRRVAAEHSA